jgi:hypothetical protein
MGSSPYTPGKSSSKMFSQTDPITSFDGRIEPSVLPIQQRFLHLKARLRIERPERFVHQQKFRTVYKHPGQICPLLHAA